jgi:hypothetical protein
MQRTTATLFIAAGLICGSPAAAAEPVFPAAGLYNIIPLNDAGAPTGNVLAIVCLVELGGGGTKSFNNIWSIFKYDGFDVNPTHHISGHWGVSVASPLVATAVLMGNDAEISASPPHPAVPVVGNVLIFNKREAGDWTGLWARWDNQDNNYLTRVTVHSAGTCTIPH